MAGMLPGVECARRRRIHLTEPYLIHQPLLLIASQGNPLFVCIPPTRILNSCLQQRSILDEACEDEELGGIAREAKKRLDERLRSQPKRQNSDENGMKGELQSKKKIVSWPKLSWKKC
ncbi:hypothetical protein ES319_D06G056700v1 [Gossypium barbadense]|uniref:Uncharacterized protein n=2 Tax=Gossypium TaxID=3633 RepID=A0A5J5QYE4_GOSBA|nr:hypothetical protein ES319_D06G056700v1 [Gossypium barbadense]KAB2023986.1 hypothetical protein ES319_D06G056700v1 [Gossypium barbadense]PPD98278.1 hypothetical protein GOBAR_DD04705 [Gossypium barbadense]TYG63842.1 hypothetical protein ES288_D06G061400v1 [Gossypium darwinii]TYG63843.1 hypothetical protein ES288_D06G061400v1 [Gossypium darwinii]